MAEKIEVKTDCFGYDKIKKGCRALRALYCANEKCRFYKTKEQYREEQKASEARYNVAKK